jgi:hypothetical protein
MSRKTNKKEKESKRTRSIPKAELPNNIKIPNRTIFPQRSQEEIERLRKEKIVFSFRFLDTKHEAFNCGGISDGWFLHLFDNLTEISKLTMSEFEQQRRHYDLHRHDFGKTAHHYKESVPEHVLEQVSPENMIQFRLSRSGGRVHGIRYHNIIYIIWLDPHHNMYPDERYGPPKRYPAPLRPYEELEQEIEKLQKQLEEKEQENKMLFDMMAEMEEKKSS